MKAALPIIAAVGLACAATAPQTPSTPTTTLTTASSVPLMVLRDFPPKASRHATSPRVVGTRPSGTHPATTVAPRPRQVRRVAPGVTVHAAPAPGGHTPTSSSVAAIFACIRQHESGGNYRIDTGNGYYGAYQFSLQTWRAIGGVGYPDDASPATQDAMAYRLLARAGWGQWSTARVCGAP